MKESEQPFIKDGHETAEAVDLWLRQGRFKEEDKGGALIQQSEKHPLIKSLEYSLISIGIFALTASVVTGVLSLVHLWRYDAASALATAQYSQWGLIIAFISGLALVVCETSKEI